MDEIVPTEFQLSQNYPDPFKEYTTIKYCLPGKTNILLEVIDHKGRKVKVLVNEVKEPGKYTVVWNGRNNDNNLVASGFYICKIKAGKFISIKKMLLLK